MLLSHGILLQQLHMQEHAKNGCCRPPLLTLLEMGATFSPLITTASFQPLSGASVGLSQIVGDQQTSC